MISSVQRSSRPVADASTRAPRVPGRDDSSTTRWPAGRLAHVVGDEQHGGAGGRPDPQQLALQHVAGDRVERGERLVHQQQPGPALGLADGRRGGQRPGQRHPLAHAAGQLVRPLVALPAEPHQRPAARPRGPGARGRPCPGEPQRQLDVAPRRSSQGSSAASWNMNAGRARADRARSPVLGASSPATRLSSVVLPQPDAPSRQTNSPGCDLQVDAAQRGHGVRAAAEGLADPAQRRARARPVRLASVRSTVEVIVVIPALSSPAASTVGLPAAVQHVVQRRHVDEPGQVGLLLGDPGGDAVLGQLRERRRERVAAERHAR